VQRDPQDRLEPSVQRDPQGQPELLAITLTHLPLLVSRNRPLVDQSMSWSLKTAGRLLEKRSTSAVQRLEGLQAATIMSSKSMGQQR